VIVAQPTAETPPILRIQVTNTDESAHGLSTAYNEFPIPINGASNDSHHIQLIPESQIEAVVWPDTAPACWKSTVLPREPLRHSERIDGGGSLTGEYALLPVAPQSEELPACWLAGTYRFSQQYWLDAANVDGVTETPTQIDEHTGERFQWVLEIQITDQQTVTVVSSTTQLD
jgi:hypothetical protein